MHFNSRSAVIFYLFTGLRHATPRSMACVGPAGLWEGPPTPRKCWRPRTVQATGRESARSCHIPRCGRWDWGSARRRHAAQAWVHLKFFSQCIECAGPGRRVRCTELSRTLITRAKSFVGRWHALLHTHPTSAATARAHLRASGPMVRPSCGKWALGWVNWDQRLPWAPQHHGRVAPGGLRAA